MGLRLVGKQIDRHKPRLAFHTAEQPARKSNARRRCIKPNVSA